ncbi:MAG: fibrobacter succinogenes major paralogous domain-containing protein [Bacteroidales bacterium]|nr:fibrobacter succinogenes major paralogous domain-containing protein [Bacteroidales bacterium]
MKTIIYSSLISLLCVLGFARAASSQIIEVCGADTITLRAGNFQNSTMRWEQSSDMEDWQAIGGEVDTIYTFLPVKNMYYRCVAKFSDCPSEFSQISLVRVPPKANAGLDRIVTGTQAWLAANQEEGETGQWTIIAGTGATLSDPASPSAQLQGQENQSYTLVWTLSNVCGSSSDTLEVEFVTNQYFDNFVVVDTTDVILSTPAQLANGQYRIRFSSPVPAVADSTVLVGMQLGGFLRMVQSVSINTANNDTIHTMQTTQATLDDITEYGAFNFGELYSLDTTLSAAKNGGYNRLTRMPTRQELMGNQKYRNGEIHYYLIGEKTSMPKGVTMSRSTSKSGSALIDFDFQSVEIVDDMGVVIVLDGHYKYTPNLVIDRKKGWLGGIDYFKLGTSNSREETQIGLSVDINATVNLLDRDYTVFDNTLYYLIIVGAVPVLVDIKFSLNGKAGAEAGVMMNATPALQQTTTTSNYIEYSNGSWGIVRESSSETKTENSYEITGGLKQTFEIGPELSFNIYSVVGPYLNAKLNQELLLCASVIPPPLNWAAKLDIWGEIKLGAKGSILGKEFIDFSTTWATDKFTYKFPESLEITMGNHHTYVPGTPPQERQIPVQVKVHSNKGFTLPGAKVMFEPDSTCSVGNNPPDSSLAVYADANGLANTTWIPGNTPESRLKAYVFDCNGTHIENSPLEFIAYADTASDCSRSNLSARLLFLEDTLSVEGKLGKPPYLYSLNDITFSGIAPKFLPMADSIYTFTIKDSLECKTTLVYKAPDPCDKYNISVDYSVYPDNVYVFEARGGKPPYLYALDDPLSFSANNTFANLHSGFHIVYAQDSLGCVGSVRIGIEAVQICGQIWMLHNWDVDVGNNWWPKDKYCIEFLVDSIINYPYVYVECLEWEWREHTEYGRLYDWATVMNGVSSNWSDPVQGICPEGWHVPTHNDWMHLRNCVGGQYASGKLRSTRTAERVGVAGHNYFPNPDGHPFWYHDPNYVATNESGFSGLPAGWFRSGYDVTDLGYYGRWWSSTGTMYSDSAEAFFLYNDSNFVGLQYHDKAYGLSLRCIRNN